MEKISRLGWVAGIVVRAYGRTIGVRVNDPSVLGKLEKHLPYGWKAAEGEVVERLYSLFVGGNADNRKLRRFHLLFGGAATLARSHDLNEVFEALERDSRMFVAEHARRRFFIHAAVVGWKGKAILIPGKSMSGKTSLAAEFVHAGATYYSDEYAVLDNRGRVHPYAKDLSIRKVDDEYRQTDHPVETFGGRAGREPIPVGIVLVTRYREGSRWRPRPVSPGIGALELLANSVSARKQPERTMDVLQKALAAASVFKSIRGEALRVVESVLEYHHEV